MRKLIALLVSVAVTAATAQPLTFITLTGAGSLSDTAIRQAAPAIEKHTGRQVVVVNMPGANGLIGVRHFLTRAANDSTLLVGNSAIGYLLETGQIDQPLVPLAGLAKSEMAVYTHTGIASLQALIESKDLKAGSTSPMTDLSLSLFDSTYHTNTTAVGYKQFGQAIIDLASGHIQYLLAPTGVSAIEGMVAAGKIHKVASLGAQFTWNAIFAPPKVRHDLLAGQLAMAVQQTRFYGVQPFAVGPEGVQRIQQQEAALMRCLLLRPVCNRKDNSFFSPGVHGMRTAHYHFATFAAAR